jgi:DivIVA domain-containing protein
MSLTPADVHNVAFSKPPIGKRGYNEDEVDAFLDLVESELARLVEENGDLKQQVEQLEGQLESANADLENTQARAAQSAGPPTAPSPGPGFPDGQERRLTKVPAPGPGEQTAPAAATGGAEATAAMLAGSSQGSEQHVQAAKVIGLAQEMADRLTGEAKSESDSMLAEARTKSEQLLSEARSKSDTMVNEARTRAETMLNEARTRAETVERQAREKATSLERDAQRKHSEMVGAATDEKNGLDKRIEELRTFEREYRTRLKTLLETSLHDLEDKSSSAAPTAHGSPNGNGAVSSQEARSSATQGYSFGPRAEAG